jgi:adenosylmethionine-8-amino-7-oxononanoate aminotransferase
VEVLQILRREDLVQRSADMGVVLERRLRAELGDHPAVSDIRGRGLFFGIELRCNREEVMMAALERDMWVYPAGSGPVADAVMVAPPFVVTEAEIDEIVTRLRAAIDSVMPA